MIPTDSRGVPDRAAGGVGRGPAGRVRVTRGGVVESEHRLHAAVVDAGGGLVASVGNPGLTTFFRSAAKPFQAVPLVEDGAADALGLTAEELALCCGSHSGEEGHVTLARGILRKAGLDEEALELGPHPPRRPEDVHRLAAEGREPAPLHNNCSGKHAGMLALAVHRGWPVEGYTRPDHPVQRRMLAEIARWTGLVEDEVATATDGCGVVCFAVPLAAMAAAFARLAKEAGARREGPTRIVDAMASHPWAVAGTERLCTAVMELVGDRVVVKTGAEGVYGGLLRERGTGFAIKAEDGGSRASGAALVRVLELLGVPTGPEREGPLASFRRPVVRNTLGDVVGYVEAAFELRTGS